MSENGRIAELEREVAMLHSELVQLRMGRVSSEDAVVTQLLRDRSVLENLPDIVTVLDRQHRLVYLNRTVPGRNVKDFIGACALDSILAEDRERYRAIFDEAWSSGMPASFEIRTLSHLWWESRFIPVRVEGQVAFMLATSMEVTQRKRAEQALRDRQKMEAIGQLTAGIAHNFNNLLSVILPNVTLARQSEGPELVGCLDDIDHAARRAADMIQQLLLFARRGMSVRPESVDLAATLRRTLQICRNTFDRGIEIELIERGSLPMVAANAGQLEQVLLNVCINARDAIEQARPEQPRIVVQTRCGGDGSAQIRISDNGTGMDEETRQRVFEPFFTTKEIGRGTGLGLASAYAIVVEHHGRIGCESQLGVGTSFDIEFPAAQAPVSGAPVAIVSTPVERGRGELVLLVDDEPLVRRAASATLVWGGYRVLEADGGPSAIAHLERTAHEIAVVLLDRSMPGMSGEQVALRLRELDATLPIVLLSGQASAAPTPALASAALSKPVDSDTLLRTIRYAIDARSRS